MLCTQDPGASSCGTSAVTVADAVTISFGTYGMSARFRFRMSVQDAIRMNRPVIGPPCTTKDMHVRIHKTGHPGLSERDPTTIELGQRQGTLMLQHFAN